MITYHKPGKILTLTAPTGGVVSGLAYKVGSLVVLATKTVAQTLPFEGLVVGVVDVPKLEAEAWTEGVKIYWDDTAKKFTTVSTSNTLVGVAVGTPTAPVIALATNSAPGDLVIVGMTIQILTFANLAGETVTVTINGVDTVLTEGVDWTAATSDDATAASLNTAINALVGVDSTVVTDTITVTPGEQATTGRVRLDGIAR